MVQREPSPSDTHQPQMSRTHAHTAQTQLMIKANTQISPQQPPENNRCLWGTSLPLAHVTMAAYGDGSLRHKVPASNRPRRQLFAVVFVQSPTGVSGAG
ncbi:MAG: hypothetical protein IJI14_12255, partial [Anaerolineaceae bacterium]|nr:hypothetical protein [Anaerolineaceae bacterium]